MEFSDIADVDDGSCATLILRGCTDDGFLEFDPDANVLDAVACITAAIDGCTYDSATNYAPAANREDGSCVFDFTPPTPCEAIDFDGSGNIGISDLLEVLNLYGSTCE